MGEQVSYQPDAGIVDAQEVLNLGNAFVEEAPALLATTGDSLGEHSATLANAINEAHTRFETRLAKLSIFLKDAGALMTSEMVHMVSTDDAAAESAQE